MIEWSIEGQGYANCNCAYGCPCQFNSLPTYGDCRAALGLRIDQGHFGRVRLDGLRIASLYSWPGAVHQGGGTMQLIVDARADREQRDALVRIMRGDDTEERATMWWVYNAMCPHKLEPVFAPIELDLDLDARRGRMVVPGVVESTLEPIRNPVTGAEHRARIDLPHGFEYRLAEVASGHSKSTGPIALDLQGTHAHFCNIHLTHRGMPA
jgi:hypothetical protein